MRVTSEILQQRRIDVEVDYERLVLVGQNLFKKRPAYFLLHVQHPQLASAGVDKYPQSQGQIRFRGEVLDGLLLAVFKNLKVVLGQVRNQCAMLVFNVEEKLDHVDPNLDRLRGLLRILGLLIGALSFLIRGFLIRSPMLASPRLGWRIRPLLANGEWPSGQNYPPSQNGQNSALKNKKFRHAGFSRDSLLV